MNQHQNCINYSTTTFQDVEEGGISFRDRIPNEVIRRELSQTHN